VHVVASSDQSSLWGDVRKLSEAGISRRTSSVDSSQILTEDTDSFIIGDRVYVGGIKSGRIAFIGETKFAPGDWAGIVLDDAVGKNDGTVGQCRYFQCEPKHGIFSRLTRLTRTPLDMPPPPATPTPSSYREAGGGFVSPTGSARSLSFSTPGPGFSTPATKGGDIRLGDRVIVMSAQGSKTGVLRFKGTTQFAQGEWCGVELDEPIGKNDGAVENVRYVQKIGILKKYPYILKYLFFFCFVWALRLFNFSGHSRRGFYPPGVGQTNQLLTLTSPSLSGTGKSQFLNITQRLYFSNKFRNWVCFDLVGTPHVLSIACPSG
ncbi:hypothetical protein WDU94_006453, partial [Cyamophila willieti]